MSEGDDKDVERTLDDRRVLLGVTGGIAAYKAADLASQLVKRGARVRAVMTRNATRFLQPLTLEALTGNRVAVEMFDQSYAGEMEHLRLEEWAEIVVVAPATANVIAKMVVGIADDLLTTLLLAVRCPVLVAPAMNTRMLENPITQANLRKLVEAGCQVSPAETGRLACGEIGQGRMASVETILAAIESGLSKRSDLAGLRFLITAGPTREAIDPVRFISNRSSGKMGYALAAAARARGASVCLLSGPTSLPSPQGLEVVSVETAEEMQVAALNRFDETDVVISAAAISDYRVATISHRKLRKEESPSLNLTFVAAPDLLASLGERKRHQLLVGFAAETEGIKENALAKLQRKRLDLIVANDISLPGAGFDADTNVIAIIGRDGVSEELPLMSKREAADRVLDRVLLLLADRQGGSAEVMVEEEGRDPQEA